MWNLFIATDREDIEQTDNQGLPDWWSYPIPNVPNDTRHAGHLIRTVTSTENDHLERHV
jgi:hypothetical protein